MIKNQVCYQFGLIKGNFHNILLIEQYFSFFFRLSGHKPVMLIEHKGYLFFKHYETGDKTYWRCRQLMGARKRCAARIVTDSKNTITERGLHCHSL